MQQDTRLLRILQNGGMIVLRADRGLLYRKQDARSRIAVEISSESVGSLLEQGFVLPEEGCPERLIWAKANMLPASRCVRWQDILPERARKKSTKSTLEAVLERITDEHKRLHVAKAAARYLRDFGARHKGTPVTMNWNGLPRSGRQKLSGSDGFSYRSLNAGIALEKVADALTEQEGLLVRAVLVDGQSVRALQLVFGWKGAEILDACTKALSRLAVVYDQHIAPEIG